MENQNIFNGVSEFYYVKESGMHDIVPLECGHEKCSDVKPQLKGIYNYFSFHLVTKGTGYYKIKNTVHKIEKNQIFCFFPGEEAEHYPDEDDPWEYYWINFVGVKAKTFIEACRFTKETPVYSYQNENIPRVFESAFTVENISTRDIFIVARIYDIFSYIIDERGKGPSGAARPSENFFTDALRYIQENYTNPKLSLKDLSASIGFSENYVSRLFKREIGMPFSEYLGKIRIQKACEYLEKSTASIKEIAFMIGISDPLYFSKKFKSLINLSPTDYVGMLKKKQTSR